jgi:hypothetical protein
MDSPPSNYNPNDSMLNGGTESIMKVMGGGGTSPPINNYDETQSILSGGIEQIQRVEGGGKGTNKNPENETDISVRYIVNYDFEDDEARDIYSRFIQTLGSQEKIQNLNQAYEREIQRLENDNKPLHYVSKPSFVIYRNSSSNLKVPRTTIKFIPTSAREIIVLPPVKGNVEVFFKQILFLRDSNYLQITRDKKFKLSTNIYVISLEPFYSSISGIIEERGKTDAELKEEAQRVSKEKEQAEEKKVDTNIANLFSGGAIESEILLKHLYLKFKKDNFYSFFLTNSPYTIIYPRQISDKNGIFFTSGIKKEFSQAKDSNDLQPIDYDTIIEKNINMMTYVNGEEKYGDNEFFVIKSGDNDPNINNTQLSFDINKYITILDLIDTEIPSTIIDINGIYYKIRMATNQGASDSVYKSWYDRKFTKQEKKLVNDLNILDMLNYKYSESDQSLINKEIADFLYYLTYYKCFKDISVLTKRECEITRGFLKELYKYNLIIKSRKIEGVKKDDITVRCSAVDIRSESIICDIIYKKNKRRRVDKVKIKKPENFNLNPEITEEIEQNALNVWRNSKKTSV